MIINCCCYLKFLFFLSILIIFLQILAQLIFCTGTFYSQTEILLTILPIFLSLLFTLVCIKSISLNSFIILKQLICLTIGGSLADNMSIVQPILSA